MEVHAHSHTPRNKWTHYFWEFLMLFLAVFCGFLAENQREHIVEKHRAKEYMQSMLDDLKLDTAEFNRVISNINENMTPLFKKSMDLLFSENVSDAAIREMYDTVPKAIRFFTVNLQENTATQLKFSGNFRLIRKKVVTDSLATYWYSENFLVNTLMVNYEAVRNISKGLIFSLFNYNYKEDRSAGSAVRKDINLKLLTADKSALIILGNHLANLSGQSQAIFKRIKELKQKAIDLIVLIQKEYRVE